MRVPRANSLDETRRRAVNGCVACVSGKNRQAKLSTRSDRYRRWRAQARRATLYRLDSRSTTNPIAHGRRVSLHRSL
jgi:hypothetical protein